MRVHELAKELDLTSKEIIEKLAARKIIVKTHMSTVDDEAAEKFIREFKAKQASSPAKKEKLAPTTPPKLAETKKRTDIKEKSKPSAVKKDATPSRASLKEVGQKVEGKPESSAQDLVAPTAAQKTLEEKPEIRKEEGFQKVVSAPPVPARKPIAVAMPITVGDLAKAINVSVAQLIKALMGVGVFANINQLLDEEVTLRAAGQLGIPVTRKEEEKQVVREDIKDNEADLILRCPVVTMMGHVDHGKTSLLDAIRKSNVAAQEAGQITQHIGAYEVRRGKDKFITFLDTPGHAAFSAMRARGATVTDVVVLVVSADDGVMPQTIEAIDHAREAGVPIVVAINKVDLPGANPDRVRQQLQKYDLVPEEWGGKTIMALVSARTGKGIDQLLESLLLEAELLELKANPKRKAEGVVLEGRMNQGEGPTTTIIVRNGTLSVGDPVLCGAYFGKVRALRNNIHPRLTSALAGQAVELLGLSGVPDVADVLKVVGSLTEARKIAAKRQEELRMIQLGIGKQKHLTLDDLHTKIAEGKIKDLKIIIKADVQGSLEALTNSLEAITASGVRLHVIHGGTGAINESDVMLAAASDAIVIGFHVKASHTEVETAIEKEGIDVRYYNIIYDAINDVTKAIEGLLEPTYKEVITGRSEIRKIFTSSKVGTIGGAYVVKGTVARTNHVRVIRSGTVIYEGTFSALKRFKDDVKDVREGFECGMSFTGFDDIRERDIVESYRLDKVAGKMA